VRIVLFESILRPGSTQNGFYTASGRKRRSKREASAPEKRSKAAAGDRRLGRGRLWTRDGQAGGGQQRPCRARRLASAATMTPTLLAGMLTMPARAGDLEEKFRAVPSLRFGSRPIALRATEQAANRRLRLYG
jgi:hypothetical protein